jgi:hypothetical protein
LQKIVDVRIIPTPKLAAGYGVFAFACVAAVVADLVVMHGLGALSWPSIALAWLCMIGYACAFSTIIVGVSHREREMRRDGTPVALHERERSERTLWNVAGTCIGLGGYGLQAAHGYFAIPEFAGQWLVEIALIFGGFSLAMLSEAAYLRKLG